LKCLFQLKLEEEIIMYGQQNLTELRDKISCMADAVPVGEQSDNPDLTDNITAKVRGFRDHFNEYM
jgi:hypothetical protein